MGLLKLATDTPGIDFYDYRDSYYYGKYKYRVRFSLEGVRYAMYEKNFDGLMKRYNAITVQTYLLNFIIYFFQNY